MPGGGGGACGSGSSSNSGGFWISQATIRRNEDDAISPCHSRSACGAYRSREVARAEMEMERGLSIVSERTHAPQ